ncbi:hypothetical protein NBRC111894_3885 [Sporolactobacillus inulinus]|uniref:Uncharacterized protein n=1 Tax=Sporolactobacillus inulinus TaxID=2078 RepID=A0A4Y1ZHA1_9BACL|nr:hypothetical protein NBRC111894_3885 [Sporolactobacillus inulinus]
MRHFCGLHRVSLLSFHSCVLKFNALIAYCFLQRHVSFIVAEKIGR